MAYQLMKLRVYMALVLLLISVAFLQYQMNQAQNRIPVVMLELTSLPKGEMLKPALVGYHHLGADLLWLKLVQVLGERGHSAQEHEWMYHALDVITTLDSQYAYAYYAGGITLSDIAKRADLSNRLLEKGANTNPDVWNIPFLIGYNYYFLLGDPARGAKYIMRAASLPGRPAYLPGLATRMAAEAGSPDTALAFLEARLIETRDPWMRADLENRMKEVLIERDIRELDRAVLAYQKQHRVLPKNLGDLIRDGRLPAIPSEPFGGRYQLDPRSGAVWSTTHPERLRVYRPEDDAKFRQKAGI